VKIAGQDENVALREEVDPRDQLLSPSMNTSATKGSSSRIS
jgi:hypothetical protein